jgi:hypothetical protein
MKWFWATWKTVTHTELIYMNKILVFILCLQKDKRTSTAESHKMEDGGWLHALAVLTPGKNAGMPIFVTPFCSNALRQFTPHSNLHCLFFCSTPMAGCTLRHCWEGTSLKAQNVTSWLRLLLQTTSVTLCSPFGSKHMVDLHFFIVPPTNTMMICPMQNNTKTDRTMNNCSNNLNSRNMYDLWVIKWMCSETCLWLPVTATI